MPPEGLRIAQSVKTLTYHTAGEDATAQFPAQLALGERIAFVAPVADAAIHGEGIRIAHFLQVVRGQGGAKTAAAVEDDFGLRVGETRLDVALDDPFSQVGRSRQVVL